jgi:hypothetical protein
VLTLVALALLGAGLAACGGGGGENADKVLKDTFSGGKTVRSGKLDVTLKIAAQGVPALSQPVELSLRGPVQSTGARKVAKFDLNLAVKAQNSSFSAGVISTGSAAFLKLSGQTYSLPPQVFQSLQNVIQSQKPDQKGNFSLVSLGVDPRKWVSGAKNEGETDVGGASTNHVSGKLDVSRFLTDAQTLVRRTNSSSAISGRVPTQLTPQQKQQIEQAIKNPTFDLYSGKDDHILRKLALKLGFTQPGAKTSGNVTFSLEFADVNKPQTIETPASPKPFSELSKALSSLGGGQLGSLLGGATGGTPSAGGIGSSSNPNTQAYAQCILAAGSDVAKAQGCAKLLK